MAGEQSVCASRCGVGEARAWGGAFSLRHSPLNCCRFQACHVEGGSAGLIPSQLLEEKRKAFVKRDLELTPTSGMRVPPMEPLIWDLTQACRASLAHLSVARDPVWQSFRKEKEANDVLDYQECRWVLEAPSLSSNTANPSLQPPVTCAHVLPMLMLQSCP